MTRTHATVLLLVPSPIAAAGLRAIASRTPDCDITAVDTTADALHDDVARLRPTLLVADPMALRTADIPALRQLAGGRLRVAALYTSALPRDITAAYDDFISIYAPADAVHAIVADAVRHSRRTEAADNPDADTDRRELSPREKEVVIGVVKGLSNKEIAAEIGVSVNTVTTHRRNIAAKLKIHSPAGLTIYAIMSKLVTLDEVRL